MIALANQILINNNFKSCFKHTHFLEFEFCNWCESAKQLGMLMSGVCCILFLGRCSTSFAHQVFDSASNQTQILVPAGLVSSFLPVLHCQVLFLCTALPWAPHRLFSSITVSPQRRYNTVDCFYSLL